MGNTSKLKTASIHTYVFQIQIFTELILQGDP